MNYVIVALKCTLGVRIYFSHSCASLLFAVNVDREDVCDMILDKDTVSVFNKAVEQQVSIISPSFPSLICPLVLVRVIFGRFANVGYGR